MPYINLTTNCQINDQASVSLKSQLAEAITLIKGKTETWLMLNFRSDGKMYFNGSDTPTAIFEVAIFGKAGDQEYDALTKRLCLMAEQTLNISPDRVYVKYTEHDRWGWNNMNF